MRRAGAALRSHAGGHSAHDPRAPHRLGVHAGGRGQRVWAGHPHAQGIISIPDRANKRRVPCRSASFQRPVCMKGTPHAADNADRVPSLRYALHAISAFGLER